MYKLCPLIFFVLCRFSGSAQNIFYSTPVGNYPYSHAKIIGKVKENIVVYNHTWSHTFDMRHSEIFVYDDEMRLLNKTSFKSIVPKICSLDFINEGDKFCAVLQYSERGTFFCDLLSFDSDGNFQGKQAIERSPSLHDGVYQVVKSPNGKSFVLIKAVEAPDTMTIVLQYHYIRDELLNRSDKIRLPFNINSSAFAPAFLDDNNLIIPLNDTANGSASLALFKINLTDKSSINTIRSLQDAFLITSSINLDQRENSYIVAGALKSKGAGIGGKIFLWRLRKDLSDIGSDTIFNNVNNNPCLQNNPYFKVSSAALKNNTSNIIAISADQVSVQEIQGPDASTGGYRYSGYSTGVSGSFYGGRVESMVPSANLNGNGMAGQSIVRAGDQYPPYSTPQLNYEPTGGNLIKVTKVKEPGVTILNVDARNNLRWTQCFNGSIEKDSSYIVDASVLVNTQNDLHIIYSKMINKDRQILNHIRVDADGVYTTMPVISMQLEYTYFLVGSFQADPHTLVIPCTINDKLAFAKLTID